MSNDDDKNILENDMLIKQATQELFRRLLQGNKESTLDLDKGILAAVVSVFNLANKSIETIIDFETFISLVKDKSAIEQSLIENLYDAVKEAKTASQPLLPFIKAVPDLLPEYLSNEPEYKAYRTSKFNPKKEMKLAQKVYFQMQAVLDNYKKDTGALYEKHLSNLDALHKQKDAEYERRIAELQTQYEKYINDLKLIYDERQQASEKENEEQRENHQKTIKEIHDTYKNSISRREHAHEKYVSTLKELYGERENRIRLLLSERSQKEDDVGIFCQSILKQWPQPE